MNQNEMRLLNKNALSEGQYIFDNSINKNFILKSKSKPKANHSQTENFYRELSALRRSYSNSRISYDKWQKSISNQRPHLNRSQNWSSKVMSEHEMENFLTRKNQSKLQSFQVLRSEGMSAMALANKHSQPLVHAHIVPRHHLKNKSMVHSLKDDSLIG